MAIPTGRKPIMALYSGATCIYSHGCRIVLFEKEVECKIIYVDPTAPAEELAELNPYNETPTLLDRDLVLYGPQIINEYLDERLPHPPLMPVDPVNRGRARLMMMRLQRDWFDLLESVTSGDRGVADTVRDSIRDGLIAISPLFNDQDYMLGAEFSLVDCFLAPLLWRLPVYGIELPKQAKPVIEYSRRLFDRPAFGASLSENERELGLS
ncbi:MAG: glutathione S-transferase N-terminal domain-containing protein [Gammaproteobacteria bacterium]|nr:glutathione S-transferase N-terminal domain-containing protein [Gammaproteobacteria bacterium]